MRIFGRNIQFRAVIRVWCQSRKLQIFTALVIIDLSFAYYRHWYKAEVKPTPEIAKRTMRPGANPREDEEFRKNKYHRIVPRFKLADVEMPYYVYVQESSETEVDKLGCEFPKLDPFSKELSRYYWWPKRIKCNGRDWVRCYHSKCRVISSILNTTTDVTCVYKDLIYVDDWNYHFGSDTIVRDDGIYNLTESDHVIISCTGSPKTSRDITLKWIGLGVGFRESVERLPVPSEREDSLNALIIAFDSTSRNGFVRKMPKSYKYLTKVMNATVFNGHNIVDDATPGALFPILTGKTDLELPNVRKSNNMSVDAIPLIFYKLKEVGYRTAYFEDSPFSGTFQYRFNGFLHQPADHYLRAFFLEESKSQWNINKNSKFCVGSTPRYKLMINITDQFLRLDGKKFILTFITDISHDSFNIISNADGELTKLLKTLVKKRVLDDTLVIVMGDHGPRFEPMRNTNQGRFEERLPFLALILPKKLKILRPEAVKALKHNKNVLTTHFDLHATLMDVLDLKQHSNEYQVPGSKLPRGMSLLEKIPMSRTCEQAGIRPHWCACTKWLQVPKTNPMFSKAAIALANFINDINEEQRDKCAIRTLTSVQWVMHHIPNDAILHLSTNKYQDYNIKNTLNAPDAVLIEYYQAKIVMDPGGAIFEGTMLYDVRSEYFHGTIRDISRPSSYGSDPLCLHPNYAHLNRFCFCKDRLKESGPTNSSLINNV